MGALMGMLTSRNMTEYTYNFYDQSPCFSYSRRVMWLNVGPSNNNPALIAGYYLDCVKAVGGWHNDCLHVIQV